LKSAAPESEFGRARVGEPSAEKSERREVEATREGERCRGKASRAGVSLYLKGLYMYIWYNIYERRTEGLCEDVSWRGEQVDDEEVARALEQEASRGGRATHPARQQAEQRHLMEKGRG
jgi:hypothetical protein